MKNLLCISLLFFYVSACGQNFTNNQSNYLYLIWDTIPFERCGYIDVKGDTIIPMGKYSICYTDTIKEFGIVLKSGEGFLGIDRNENVLFEVYPYDNGPDIPSEGLFRIIKNGKIGYANLKGEIVIKPKYKCAFPFDEEFALVSKHCMEIREGENLNWRISNWITIYKTGKTAIKWIPDQYPYNDYNKK